MLSRAGSEEREEPVPKRARFFPPTQAQPEKVDSNSEDDLIVVAPPVASCAAQITPPRTEGLQESKRVPVDWNEREFAEIVVEGYTSYRASTFCSLVNGEAVTLHRTKPPPSDKAIKKGKEDTIVRFKNSKGIEVGRVVEIEAEWISRLLDLGMASFAGVAIDVPVKFQSGDTVVLSLKPTIFRMAFHNPNLDPPTLPKSSNNKLGTKLPFPEDAAKETAFESMLAHRKNALNSLFDRTNLLPVHDSAPETISVGGGPKGKGKSARGLLEKYDAVQKKVKKKEGSVDLAVAEGLDSEEGIDGDGELIDQNALNLVYSKAKKNDAFLPEMDPPSSFKLELRQYQKQALRWMSGMEGIENEGEGGEGREVSMHPLWEEYRFPASDDTFYYNPYSGELSLEFPRASKKCRGGILADEMGLGKTIMISALIETNTDLQENEITPSSPIESIHVLSDSSSEEEAKPPTLFSKARQTRLGQSTGSFLAPKKLRKTPRATLVVAPMTLLDQWVSELLRSGTSKPILYYGNNRSNLMEEIAGGASVVVTSYGTLNSEFKKYCCVAEVEKEKGKGKAKAGPKPKVLKASKRGLFGIDWFRVVLDEAHNIRNRATLASKAACALSASRRWCLTGTPIVNRLEDLFSLLQYLQLAPWSNFSFFRTFVTVPFSRKDPKAIATVQIVLESILLRREKKMKDRDGNPIVGLPGKIITMDTLKFSKEERLIYDALYRNAKSKFLGYEQAGSTLKNVTAIFSILMRLRQAVLHPTLVLKRLTDNLAEAKGKAKTKAEREVEVDEGEIAKMIENYAKGEGGNEKLIQEMLDRDDGVGEVQECEICLDALETPVQLPVCDCVGCRQCVLSHFTKCEEQGNAVSCPICGAGPINEKALLQIQRATSPVKTSTSQITKRGTKKSTGPSSEIETIELMDSSDEDIAPVAPPTSSKGKGKAKQVDVKAEESEDDDDEEMVDGTGKSASMKGDFKSSTKLDSLVAYLTAARDEEPNLKAVVFSNFTGFLTLIELALTQAGFNHVRLDGTLTQKARAKVVTQFTTTQKSSILLASMKAGGVGLNLVCATRVVLMDSWWNAATEDQAVDRIHRFGQTREVHVKRFLIENSIEAKIIKIQERKKKIVGGALGGRDSDGKSKQDLSEDLRAIFED